MERGYFNCHLTVVRKMKSISIVAIDDKGFWKEVEVIEMILVSSASVFVKMISNNLVITFICLPLPGPFPLKRG
jgi:hypothetical protein